MENMAQRWPDKAKLREQIYDASKANPNTVMPPFGSHQILTPDEIDKVVEFVLTL
jgi:sulfur-oxidizing protein SoxX